jgi:hypothetical protein
VSVGKTRKIPAANEMEPNRAEEEAEDGTVASCDYFFFPYMYASLSLLLLLLFFFFLVKG